MMAPQGRSEKGVALITALLVVALATTAAVTMASRQQLDIRRTGNILNAEQAHLYVLGMEGWAGQILLRDGQQNKVDNLGEDWATVLPPIPIEGGQLTGAVKDLQGRFNLNRLVQGNKVNPLALERFQRLLTALGLDPALSMAVVDWIDPDVQPSFPAGAEDGTYLSTEVPYRAANRPMVSPTELRMVAGFSQEIYDKLLPYVTALPSDATLNVNTVAPDQPELYMALSKGLSLSAAKALLELRGDKGFASVQDFLKQPALAGQRVDAQGLSVATHYFVVTSSVLVGHTNLSMNSVLKRDSNAVRTVFRAQGTL